MPNPCGKSCETCTVRETYNCGGCDNVLDTVGCEIAACCRDKNHDSCETCNRFSFCTQRQLSRSMPKRRAEQAELEYNRQLRQFENARILSHRLSKLFILSIFLYATDLLLNDTLLEGLRWGTGLRILNLLLYILGYGFYAYLIYPLRTVETRYGTAAKVFLLSALFHVPMILYEFLPDPNTFLLVLNLLFALLSGGFQIYAVYCTCSAHSDALSGLDSELSARWELLYKWQIGLLLFLLCMPVVAVFGFIGGLALLAAAIALYVIDVLILVYLHRTVRIFRECAEHPPVQ